MALLIAFIHGYWGLINVNNFLSFKNCYGLCELNIDSLEIDVFRKSGLVEYYC
ncbi:MAG: hypothetical protein KAW92_13870 [Candidatus Cloacimonetes bacterium]|nr:hypothetical protein [Candidatus Cloacimonadota bacterium]